MVSPLKKLVKKPNVLIADHRGDFRNAFFPGCKQMAGHFQPEPLEIIDKALPNICVKPAGEIGRRIAKPGGYLPEGQRGCIPAFDYGDYILRDPGIAALLLFPHAAHDFNDQADHLRPYNRLEAGLPEIELFCDFFDQLPDAAVRIMKNPITEAAEIFGRYWIRKWLTSCERCSQPERVGSMIQG